MAQGTEETNSESSYDQVVSPSEFAEEVASVVVSDSEDTQSTNAPTKSENGFEIPQSDAKAETRAGDDAWKRDDTFFFFFVTFRVEDQLFRVSRDAFEHQSEHFRNLFATQARTGTSGDIDEPIFLEGVEKNSFRDLLRLLYPPPRTSSFTGPILLTREQWIKVLDLAQTWGFTGTRDLAIQKLELIKLEEVEKLELALKYEIKQWYADAYLALAKRPEPLTTEEGRRLGLDLSLKMAQIRERRLARMMGVPPDAKASANKPASAFAPYGGSYLPFGSTTTAKSQSLSSSGNPQASHNSIPFSFPMKSSLPNPEFGKTGFGFPTTADKDVSSSDPSSLESKSPAECSTPQTEKVSTERWLIVDYDDAKLKQDVKESFGL